MVTQIQTMDLILFRQETTDGPQIFLRAKESMQHDQGLAGAGNTMMEVYSSHKEMPCQSCCTGITRAWSRFQGATTSRKPSPLFDPKFRLRQTFAEFSIMTFCPVSIF